MYKHRNDVDLLVSEEHSVTFIDIGGTRDPHYRIIECAKNHIHARITVPACQPVDLTFATPEDAYDFAQALLRSYDRAVGIAEQ